MHLLIYNTLYFECIQFKLNVPSIITWQGLYKDNQFSVSYPFMTLFSRHKAIRHMFIAQ